MTHPMPSTVCAPSAPASGPATRYPTGSSASEPIQSHALTRPSARGGMWRASAVSHQIISSEKPNPVANANTTTTDTGAPSANSPSWTGQASVRIKPVASGCRGRQRSAISAPITAPTPATLSSTPNTPALP